MARIPRSSSAPKLPPLPTAAAAAVVTPPGVGPDAASRGEAAPRASAPVLKAVVDIGTTSIRLAIAEIGDDGSVRVLTSLSQAVNLGKDTFTRGWLEKSTVEECVRVLRSYRKVLTEYGLTRPEQVRVVATSAVREAQNRLAFLDRIYTATQFDVVPIDDAEVNRITYLGVQPHLRASSALAEGTSVITEVGGGSTEVLVVRQGDVQSSQTYRLGSLRMRETLDALHAPQATFRSVMETQIRRMVHQVQQLVGAGGVQQLVGLGGDIRFAARQLVPDAKTSELVKLPLGPLQDLTNRILDLSEDGLVHRYHIAFPDASTLGPALMAYVELVKAFGLDGLWASDVNLRDGLLKEIATRGSWNEDFTNQVYRSAVELGRKFHFAEDHARHVAKLCKILFQGLRDEHQLEPRYELLLTVAALLHEIGLFIGTTGYHKHSMYLVTHSELFGLSRTDVSLIGLTARYHRRASPKPTHTVFTSLSRDQRIAIVKLAALLRVAIALDASHTQRLHELLFSREGGRLIISVPQAEDVSLEQLALKQSGSLFEETYGMPVLLRKMSL